MFISIDIIEDEKSTAGYYGSNFFCSYTLTSINNKTISFKIKNYYYNSISRFTLLDLTKEINTTFDNFLFFITKFYNLIFQFNPVYPIIFNIQEINTEQTIFFISEDKYTYKSYYNLFCNGYIEFCYDNNCLNNTYNSSRIIQFKKNSKY